MSSKKFHGFLLFILLLVFVWSAIGPKDYFTWLLEIMPGVVGLAILFALYKKFQFTNLTYSLISIHIMVLFVGGHYTYAEVPLFNWIRDQFGLERNYYDRLGHFMQGFVPAIIAREVLIRKNILAKGRWMYLYIISIAALITVVYEFLEWWAARLTGEAADAFLGTQGDSWDTQWDMFMCLIGANVALLALSKIHDKYISKKIN